MTEEKRVLAFDFGASSGRAVVGTFDGRTIHMEEVHRFANDPVMVRGTMYWDVLRLFHEIKQGMTKAHLSGPVASIGIDTWGVDFGLLDQRGNSVRESRSLPGPAYSRHGRRSLRHIPQENLESLATRLCRSIHCFSCFAEGTAARALGAGKNTVVHARPPELFFVWSLSCRILDCLDKPDARCPEKVLVKDCLGCSRSAGQHPA